jgi:hypothetical protein
MKFVAIRLRLRQDKLKISKLYITTLKFINNLKFKCIWTVPEKSAHFKETNKIQHWSDVKKNFQHDCSLSLIQRLIRC